MTPTQPQIMFPSSLLSPLGPPTPPLPSPFFLLVPIGVCLCARHRARAHPSFLFLPVVQWNLQHYHPHISYKPEHVSSYEVADPESAHKSDWSESHALATYLDVSAGKQDSALALLGWHLCSRWHYETGKLVYRTSLWVAVLIFSFLPVPPTPMVVSRTPGSALAPSLS